MPSRASRGGVSTDPVRGAEATAADVTVRAARPGDVSAIWELARGFAEFERLSHEFTGTPERLAEHMFGDAQPRIDAFVAERGGRAIGFAITYFMISTFWTRPLLWLEDLYVDPAHRGSGAGKALMQAVAAHA